MSDTSREPLEPELLPRPGNWSGVDLSGFRRDEEIGEASPARPFPRRRLALILFFLTCASTIYAGAGQFAQPKILVHPVTGQRGVQFQVDPRTGKAKPVIDRARSLLNGLTYAAGVMLILGAHEMGHYLQARRYRVPASLPMFIPMPITPFGTMGAVIVQDAGVADRKSMFDIAISGPLAGLVVALPLNWWGIQHSEIGQITPGGGGWTNPLIVEWMISIIHRPLLPGEDIALTPIVFAGWVGIFITGLNLIPIGQLDGGHILYCLLGRRAHQIARALFVGAVVIVVFNVWRGHQEYMSWSLMLFLIWLMGTRHPPTANDRVPLGKARIILGWLTLSFIVIGFVPAPMYTAEPVAPPARTAPVIEQPPAIEVAPADPIKV
jgi:membrane-associated protease RseP (regulator of RpoE activity)